MTSLEETVEDYFIELLGKNQDLAGIPIVSFESDDEATTPAIVIQAVQKDHRLDGPRGFNVAVSFLYRATATTSDESNAIASAIRKSIYGAQPGQTYAESLFGFFMILDETMSGERNMSKDLKKRQVSVSTIARIEDE